MYFQGSIPVLPTVKIMIRDMITWRINRTLPLILTYLFIFLRCARFELEAPAFLGGLFFCGLTLLLLIYVTPIKKNTIS